MDFIVMIVAVNSKQKKKTMYVSIKISNGYIKIKYYFTDFDVLKMNKILPKIEDFLFEK